MPKPFYHEGQVEAEGEKLTLVCDIYAIDCIESVTGQNWDDILPQLADPPTALLTKILWGFLRRKHEGVTLDEAAGLAFGPDKKEVGVVLGDVLRRACNLPDEDGGEAEAPAADAKKKPSGRSRTSAKSG
jgi:hypothetical protein